MPTCSTAIEKTSESEAGKYTPGTDARRSAPKLGTPRCSLIVLMLAVVSLVSTATTEAVYADTADTSDQVQLMCPVMTDEKVDPDISVEYQGRTVYLCCQKCRIKFEAAPEKYASAIVTTTNPAASDDHDHSQDHNDAAGSSMGGVLNLLGRLHPIAVHFPIALLTCAALARCMMLFGSITWAGSAVRFCVLIGGVSAVVAAALGWLNAGWPGDSESFGDVIFNHRWLGVGTAVLSVVLIVLIEMEARKPTETPGKLTTLGLLVVAGLVGATGHFGGILVFGPDYLPW